MTYRGRFAPSPTGPLHFGSLVAALASWLDARANSGQWLVRIEDLDPLRECPSATEAILTSLQHHGLHWDESVRHQSQRSEAYDAILAQWRQQQRIYPCACSRKALREHNGLHPARCRSHPDWQQPGPVALRFGMPVKQGQWQDRLLGPRHYALNGEPDDVVVRRKEGFYAYHLAVVVDDIDQGITDIVRGQDLLELTPIHLQLYEALGATPPSYLHIPLMLNDAGQKLSKQNQAPALDDDRAPDNLRQALRALGLKPPQELAPAGVEPLLDWAVSHWDTAPLKG